MDVPLQTTSFEAISTSGLAIDSSSDLSYSPGPSQSSTRNTSPDSASTDAHSGHSSPLISLSVASAVIEYASDTTLDRTINMDKSSFQSLNDRRSKVVGERPPSTQYPHVRQQQLTSPQLQVLRPNIQGPLGHHRSLTSANWRSSTSEDVNVAQPRMMYSHFETATPVNPLQHPSMLTPSITTTRRDQHHYFQHVAATSTSCPSLGPIYDAQLDSSFAYCYDRGNGQYTRLVPADMLPPLQNIPAIQHGYVGMVVVPQPRGLPPNGHWNNTEPVVVRSPPATPPSPADTIQSRIDNIVATTPSTTSHASPGPSNNAAAGHRRPKIYCDKWVHEGVCAFTQQGCKYKHEMPSDKLTQHQLGLFHGYPQWWKKQQADLSRQRDAPSSDAPKSSSQSSRESRGVGERYLVQPAGSPTAGGSPSCGGLTPDLGGQLAWRQNGEYISDPQILAAASPTARTSTRGMSGAMRNAMTANTPDRNLSPCPISYGSPFGPIAPPARNNAMTFMRTDCRRSAPTAQTGMEPRSMPHGTGRSSPIGNGNASSSSSALPTSNPYASLEALDDGNDQNPNESVSFTKASHSARLS